MAIQLAPFKRSQHVGDDAGTLLFAIVSPHFSLHSYCTATYGKRLPKREFGDFFGTEHFLQWIQMELDTLFTTLTSIELNRHELSPSGGK